MNIDSRSINSSGMSMAPVISNVLILGGGDGFAVREILKYKEVKTLH